MTAVTLGEERLSVRLAAAGDEDAVRHLVEDNLGLVVTKALRMAGRGVELEDLVAEGNRGLLEAARRARPGHDARFATYAAYWIEKFLRLAVETANAARARAEAPETRRRLASRARVEPPPTALAEMAEARAWLRSAVQRLPPRVRAAVRARFGFGRAGTARSVVDVGRAIGLSRQGTQYLLQDGLERLLAMWTRRRRRRP